MIFEGIDFMNIFVARQPIFDVNMRVVAYELLYRSSENNQAVSDGDDATSSVIINGLLMIGLESLTDNKQTYIKFTRNLLLDDTVSLLPSGTVVVEVLGSLYSDPTVAKALHTLKGKGYSILMEASPEWADNGDALKFSNLIKVDFKRHTPDSIIGIAQQYRGTPTKLVADKVETPEQFEIARKLGYTYFQGYFFSKPQISATKDIQSIKSSHVRILKELGNPEPDFDRMADVIESDLALSYKLLKLVNSGAYFGVSRITSIRQALTRLGIKEVLKWVALVMMRDSGRDKPEELVRTSMVRGRALESLAAKVKLGSRKNEFFLMGIFSMMDSIMDRPMEAILTELPLDDEIVSALMGRDNLLRKGFEILLAYEKADWDALENIGSIGVDMNDGMLIESYFDAIRWTQEFYIL